MHDCPLCDLVIKTQLHYRDNQFVCVDCDKCGVPMWLIWEHRAEFTDHERNEIISLTKRIFNTHIFEIRWHMRSVPGHAHCHVERLKRLG